jgi:DUF4097 and DUF4098 domain-containing protein YvlB
MKNLLTAVLVSTSVLTATAQTAPTFTSSCEQSKNSSYRTDKPQRACETRDLTLPALGGKTLNIDGNRNGGITVRGWSGSDVRVRAIVQAWDNSEADAQKQLPTIRISTDNNTLRADAPGETWAVSYEVYVPQQTSLALSTKNGGISLENVRGAINFTTTNGGVTLAGLGGDVKGRTTNGGLSIKLTGDKWEGTGLDVATTNGGITWDVPQNYSARLTTSTNVGGVKANLPITKNGMLGREIATTLGQGGAPVKAVTTNGGISVRQK